MLGLFNILDLNRGKLCDGYNIIVSLSRTLLDSLCKVIRDEIRGLFTWKDVNYYLEYSNNYLQQMTLFVVVIERGLKKIAHCKKCLKISFLFMSSLWSSKIIF